MIILIILICIWIYFEKKKYEESTYYKITRNSFLNVHFNKGKYGEYLTFKRLQFYENMGAKFLFNMYIPKGNWETTELDLIMITTKGIIVFESKNYAGWIFGDEKSRMWMQILPAGKRRSHKRQFFNPILQNDGHINNLRRLIDYDIPIFSVIVFSESCTLKKSPKWKNEVKVVKRNHVCKAVEDIFMNNLDKLDQARIQGCYDKLYEYSQTSIQIKQQHIYDIRNKY